MSHWYAHPVLFVADIDRSVDFYVNQLGFTRYEEAGKARVVDGNELYFPYPSDTHKG